MRACGRPWLNERQQLSAHLRQDLGLVRVATIDDIFAAADRIRHLVLPTPLIPAPWGDADRPLWIKPESLQAVGSSKVRGAFNMIGQLGGSARSRGVVAYSSGNHAQAVAHAAAIYGIHAHIVMPEETPNVKVAATRSRGAQVLLCGPGERERVAAEVVDRTGAVLVPPFDHLDATAGQGTIGLEIATDLPDVANVLVTVSGGGLASGTGTAVKALCPNARCSVSSPSLPPTRPKACNSDTELNGPSPTATAPLPTACGHSRRT